MTTTMTASASAITIPAPVGLSYFPFQDDVIKNYLVPSQRILLGDEMGLGTSLYVMRLSVLFKMTKNVFIQIEWKYNSRSIHHVIPHDRDQFEIDHAYVEF